MKGVGAVRISYRFPRLFFSSTIMPKQQKGKAAARSRRTPIRSPTVDEGSPTIDEVRRMRSLASHDIGENTLIKPGSK
jgi:hypothetical protein